MSRRAPLEHRTTLVVAEVARRYSRCRRTSTRAPALAEDRQAIGGNPAAIVRPAGFPDGPVAAKLPP